MGKKIRSKDILNFCSLSVSFIHSHSCKLTADLNSPFLPEFGGPGGLSVTDPVNKNKHNMYKAKTRQQQVLRDISMI